MEISQFNLASKEHPRPNKALHRIPDPPRVETLMPVQSSTLKLTLALGQGCGEL
jgi:hypothetical protein